MTKESKSRVLIIEDESALLFALKAELTHSGYEVSAALSGEEGANKAMTEKPAVILLDLLLPEMSGFEVMERLQSNDDTKDIPVIVVSNLADSDNVERSKKLGAIDYLIKTDYSLERIVERIKEAIDKHV